MPSRAVSEPHVAFGDTYVASGNLDKYLLYIS